MNVNSKILWVNHASMLIKKNNRFILTDPWDQTPAFSNLLASTPMSMHPAYLAALKDKLTILISHNHTDHYDIKLLDIFDKNTLIILADLKCKSLYNQIKSLGFTNIKEINNTETYALHDIKITGYINSNDVHEDAIFAFDLGDGIAIHANDHYYQWPQAAIDHLKPQIAKYQPEQVTLWGQAHSATGYPLNTTNLTDNEKRQIVIDTAKEMLRSELKTAAALNITQYVSYAGFIAPYVPNHDNYRELVLLPTRETMLKITEGDNELTQLIQKINILDIYPQDILEVASGEITKSFVSNHNYTDQAIRQATATYYKKYKIEPEHEDSSNPPNAELIEKFCSEINKFVAQKLTGNNASFQINCNDNVYQVCGDNADVVLTVNYNFLEKVIQHKMSFEDLYTGFLGQWTFKNPKTEYDNFIDCLMVFAHQYMIKNITLN